MNVKIYFTLAITILTLGACNNTSSDPEFNYQSSTNPTDSIKDSSNATLPAVNTGQTTQPNVVTVPTQTKTTTSTAANKNLNPEHGKPGHRCDIAVGAPLDSKPVTTSNQQVQTQQIQTQTVTTTPTPAPKTVTAAGMNPPHGDPGHRCDIPVGTPLSQPVKKDPAP